MSIEEEQVRRVNALVERLNSLSVNSLYAMRGVALRPIRSISDLQDVLPTRKTDLVEDQSRHPPFGRVHILPLSSYTRIHQTSGTTGKPLRWLDGEEDWSWWKRCWARVYASAGLGPGDTTFFPCNFNFFIGYWSAFDAASACGIRVLAGGGQDTRSRLQTIERYEPEACVATPSYAYRMCEVAEEQGIKLAGLSVRKLFLMGECGGSVPEVRDQLESRWGAKVFDHYGCTELGAMGYQCGSFEGGFHLNDEEFVFEVLEPQGMASVPDREVGELLVTNLGRVGSPLIRYRTGDLVRLTREPCACGSMQPRCLGGILGRADDLIVVKGTNVYPSALTSTVRRFGRVVDFRCLIDRRVASPRVILQVEVEGDAGRLADDLKAAFRSDLGLTPDVEVVARGALGRSDGKTNRFQIL